MKSDRKMAAALNFFSKREEILLAIVFGSFAQGTAEENSDFDIAYASATTLSIDDRLQLSLELSKHLQSEVDVVDLHASHGALLQEILTRGKLLVNKDPACYEQLINRMLREKEDDGRFLEKVVEERKRAWSRQIKH